MKNTAIRTFVLVLAVAGFSASSFLSASASSAVQTNEAKTLVPQANVLGSPMPMCMPNQPDGCGIR